MAASETAAPSLQNLNMANAQAALAGLFGLPAAAPGTALTDNGLALGNAASGGHWNGAGHGFAPGLGSATGYRTVPGAGGSIGAGPPREYELRPQGVLHSRSGPSGVATGGLWNRSFAFSIATWQRTIGR